MTGRSAQLAATLWGDGFAGDTLRDFWTAREWDLCSPDEYILLFPGLVPPAGEFPGPLWRHLETCVAVRAWRLARLDAHGEPPSLQSRVPDGADQRQQDWFAADDAVTWLLRRVGLLHPASVRLDTERKLLAFLDGVLSGIQCRRLPAWDEPSEALLAFGAGIHPAYLWPQAAVSHARGTAAGWLGHLDRGRTALMPMIVAEYVLDALGGGPSSDRQLIGLVGDANLGLLRHAARRRAAGQDPVVRLSPGGTSLAAWFANRSHHHPVALGIET